MTANDNRRVMNNTLKKLSKDFGEDGTKEQITSIYATVSPDKWIEITKELLARHPLKPKEIVDVVLTSWTDIFKSKIGRGKIGQDIFPKPQIMGFLLHELIPLELAARYPKLWRGEKTSADKDIVCVRNEIYSIEVKTSSNPKKIFGNRSFSQETSSTKKSKDGFYLAINFQSFTADVKSPCIVGIRFGWLDSTDWRAQKAASGQQASLSPDVYKGKLIPLYEK